MLLFQENRFSKCDTCVKLKMEKRESVSKAQQEMLQQQLRTHLDKVEYVISNITKII